MHQSLDMANTGTLSNLGNEKRWAALTGVVAAIGLITLKLVVGLMTNSFGILAAAASSGLGLVAAWVILLALLWTGEPPGSQRAGEHHKAKNLCALSGALLLLIACGWIVCESIARLLFQPAEVITSVWGLLAMGTSIVIDLTCWRILGRVANKYSSRMLEADALLYKTDVWTSSLVIIGLAGAQVAAQIPGLGFLWKADAVAALLIAMIVFYVSFRVGMQAVGGLLAHAPGRAG